MSRPGPLHEAREHRDPAVVFGPPCAGVIGRLLVGLDALGGRRLLPFDPLIDRKGRDAERLPVLEPDRIDQNQRRDVVRIHQRIARRDHAAGRVGDQHRVPDADRLEQRVGVLGELMKAVLVALGLRGLAEADLVGRDDAIAGA